MIRWDKKIFIALLFVILCSYSAQAQCSICRAVLESEEGQATAKGINDGIVYLMAMPYTRRWCGFCRIPHDEK